MKNIYKEYKRRNLGLTFIQANRDLISSLKEIRRKKWIFCIYLDFIQDLIVKTAHLLSVTFFNKK